MPKLGVNIDHIATLRQARMQEEPDPVIAAAVCESAGADGITVHLREDRRHIQDYDVEMLRKTIKTKLNLEMAAVEDVIRFAVKIKPDDVCLVPEKRRELTTEGGLNVSKQKTHIEKTIKRLHKAKIRVSIFINPDEKQIRDAIDVGADCVELHTGKYALDYGKRDINELERIRRASVFALDFGLILNAGHGLDYKNVLPVARLSGMNELNIGFSIIARAMIVGLENAVREMKELLQKASEQGSEND